MSLDLLKERFGSSTSINKKEVDKEKLNKMFNSNNTHGLLNINEQHQKELEEKDKIIENLKQELDSQWLTNKTAFNTKKLYEDKIKKMNIVDSTNLIPTLVEVSKQKQGNVKLDWMSWLEIPESNYLFQINESLAKKVFQENNLLIDRLRYKQRGGVAPVAKNYFLSFTGDTNTSTRRGDLVATDFNPDDFDLPAKGFTISYWVRPDELGADMFAIGRKAHNNERFTFGISRRTKGYFGVGANQSERSWETMLDAAGMDKSTHLEQDGSDWILKVGTWYHFAVTYAGTNAGTNNMLRKIYMNGQQIWGTGVSDPDNKGNIAWSQTGTEMSKGLSFGMRAVRGSGDSASYNNGWACGLDEVAIYDEEKDANWISNVYNGGTDYDHSAATKSDNDSTAKAAGTSQRGLVGYWKFNEGSGTRVEDLSGFGNHGLLTNDSHGDDGGAAFAEGTPTWEEIKGY